MAERGRAWALVAADGAMWEDLEVDDMVARGWAGPIRWRMGPYGVEIVVDAGLGAGIGDWDWEGEVGLM